MKCISCFYSSLASFFPYESVLISTHKCPCFYLSDSVPSPIGRGWVRDCGGELPAGLSHSPARGHLKCI